MPSISSTLTRKDWLWLAALWSVAALTLVLRGQVGAGPVPLFADTDDAMRMVVARDLLGGQGWYDLVQHRLNTPFGAEIHWSRLIDLPLAGLLALGQVFGGPEFAIGFAATVWPLLLLALLLWLSAGATLALVGRDGLLPALALPILSPAVLAEFTPGRVDHHGVVILLALACLWATIAALRRPGAAWLAGALAATALAIAIESVPMVAAAIVAFGLVYVADARYRANLMAFGLALALGTLFHLMLARPPWLWLDAACDMISPVFVLAMAGVGGAYVVVAVLPAPHRAWQRLALLATLGTAVLAVLVLVYPQCLGGPYAGLDPWLRENWLDIIVEARPWHETLPDLPAYAIAVALPLVLALCAVILAMRREPENRLGWLVLLVFLVLVSLVMLTQVRAARIALPLAVPAAAWLIVRARAAYLARKRLGAGLVLIGSWLLVSGVVISIAVNLVMAALPSGRAQFASQTRASKLPCLTSEAFDTLRSLPPGRAMSPIDLGSHVLLETGHAVVAAPYHRNQAGVRDAFRFFNLPADTARTIAKERGLDLVVTCPAMPEMRGSGLKTEGSLLNLLAAGTPPDWLEPVPDPGPLEIYTIAP
ncbi:MAG: hypothetical protein KIT02_13660 [Devosia sp.]|uniref:hypothetical protein n=1 Tax=Devosia sp. TaxID=1871048 RepID=UPI0024C589DE|nr:hypothetical protein [Devosia sp.]UYN98967.1 MAG: hypothetical protein KIT02_13660 [Devosia sp.]